MFHAWDDAVLRIEPTNEFMRTNAIVQGKVVGDTETPPPEAAATAVETTKADDTKADDTKEAAVETTKAAETSAEEAAKNETASAPEETVAA